MALSIGNQCPSFSLFDQNGIKISSSNLIGSKNLIIYFYPKDDTPGCTKEACSFRDNHEAFRDLGCEVIGISADSVKNHLKFSKKYNLTFTLLADTHNELRKAFGVPANLFGLIPGRVTYIIDKKGTIRGIYNSQTDPLGHIQNALTLVKSL